MKVVQILYSGIGGVGSVAFELIEGDVLKKWKSVFFFLGVEKIFPGFKKKCKDLKIKFYLYDNSSSDNTIDILRPYLESGEVTYCYFPYKPVQKFAYSHCLKHHGVKSQWIAFICLLYTSPSPRD